MPPKQRSPSIPSAVPSRPIDDRRVPRSARWQGHPLARPPTDAELALRDLRRRRVLRLLQVVLGCILLGYLVAPQWMLAHFLAAPPQLRPYFLILTLIHSYPWLQFAAVGVLILLLLHLCVAAVLVPIQRRTRRARVFRTLALDIAATPMLTPLHGVDFFVGLQHLQHPRQRWRGAEETLVFALVAGDDGRAQLRVRGPAQPRDWTTFLRQQIAGRAPGTTARPVADDLREAIEAARPGQVLAWADLLLARDAAYPLNDLGQFVSDPLGPLAAALQTSPAIAYAAYEILVRAVEDRWRLPVRTQLAQIEARLTPDDLAAHAALLRKAAQVGYDVVVRCLVIADDAQHARAHLRDMRDALAQFERTTCGVTQRLQIAPLDRLIPGGGAGHVVSIPPPVTVPTPVTAREILLISGLTTLAALLGAALGGGAISAGWPTLAASPEHLRILPTPTAPPWFGPAARAISGGLLGALVGLLLALAQRPSRARWRDRHAIAEVAAHAHRFAWPGPRWPLPLPGRHRSVMGVFDLAALWHIPDATLAPLVAFRTVRALPVPARAFLAPHDAAAAERGMVLPPPKTPLELGRRRLALAAADHPDGTRSLMGPTIRDLRQGMEILGPMGSGKSCFLETLAVEIARTGGGFGLIDAKGDLADRLLAALPAAARERVVVIDTSASLVPCINPLDARLLGAGVTIEQLAGQVEHLFARIDPETWQTSLGMQQFCRFGLYALCEGEPAPTLLHFDRLYLSRAYRDTVLARVQNPAVLDFWRHSYPAMDLTLRRSLESFRRRLQRFVTAPLLQQLIGQPRSTIDLPTLMDQRGILIVKLVPEAISEELGRVIATALLGSLIVATVARQAREPDPELRWDWPLLIDEIQKFVDVEHPGAAETFLTQTRAFGVGLIGAHQGLWQLSPAMQAAVIQALGGVCVLGPVKQDAVLLTQAYAETGLTEADLAALRPRHELLIRFPILGRDSGLVGGAPRPRPPAVVASPALRGRLQATAAHAPFRAVRAPAPDPLAQADDRLLEDLWRAAAQQGPLEAAGALVQHLARHAPAEHLLLHVERLRDRSAAHRQAQAAALAAASAQLPDAAMLARELSALRWGVDPAISACFALALTRHYPADPATPQRNRERTASPPTPPAAPPATAASTAPAPPPPWAGPPLTRPHTDTN